MILEYLKKPSPTSTVVFQAVSLDQRRKLTSALMKTCTVVAFERLTEQQATRWAEEFLKRRGCRIEPSALGHLIGLVGTRLNRLSNELEKLATYAGGGFINSAAVDELVPRAREHSSFELWEAILERDRKRALKLMQRLLDDGDNVHLMILGSLAALYRKILTGKELMARGASFEEISKATGQYGQRAKEFNMRIGRMAREEIIHGLRRITEVDNSIKNSEATPKLQMQYLIAELTLPDSARWGIFH
jgi:DNA polymerase-3 subunit delta